MTDAYEAGDGEEHLDTGPEAGAEDQQGGEQPGAEGERQPLEPAELERRAADKDRALKAERAARRSERRHFETQIAELRGMIQGSQGATKKEPAPEINPEEDPIGALVQRGPSPERGHRVPTAREEVRLRLGEGQVAHAHPVLQSEVHHVPPHARARRMGNAVEELQRLHTRSSGHAGGGRYGAGWRPERARRTDSRRTVAISMSKRASSAERLVRR